MIFDIGMGPYLVFLGLFFSLVVFIIFRKGGKKND